MSLLALSSTPVNQTLITYSHSLIPSSSFSRTHNYFAVAPRSTKSSKISRVRSFKSTDETSAESSSDKIISEKKQWGILQVEAWNVPWDWKIVLYVMTPYLMSILLTGIVESKGLEVLGGPHSQDVQTSIQSTDEAAVRLLIDQSLKTVIKLSVLNVFVSPYQPFSEDIFSYRWTQPFNLHKGWFLWGIGGLIAASTGVLLLKAVISGSNVSQVQNQILWFAFCHLSVHQTSGYFLNKTKFEFLWASFWSFHKNKVIDGKPYSPFSTVSLLGILGVLAPLCEETIYRGFLLTSLTKWLPVHVSVFLSSVVFALAHQSPGKSAEIFIFGMVLGLVYTRTRNLLAPITMHACWNLGVVLLLIYYQSQGDDIHKYVS